MTDDKLFRSKAPGIMRQLIADFDLITMETGAILGNIGHECGGFHHFQELKPLVPGSKGGYGWCMWTGPRRRQFEAYVARNNLDPKSDKANYGFLWNELKGLIGSEGAAIGKLKHATPTLRDKVIAFELAFERAHASHKHYDARVKWAEIALDAFKAAPPGDALPSPEPPPLLTTLFNALLAFVRKLTQRRS